MEDDEDTHRRLSIVEQGLVGMRERQKASDERIDRAQQSVAELRAEIKETARAAHADNAELKELIMGISDKLDRYREEQSEMRGAKRALIWAGSTIATGAALVIAYLKMGPPHG